MRNNNVLIQNPNLPAPYGSVAPRARVTAVAAPCQPAELPICDTSWSSSAGLMRPAAPERAPCGTELSEYRKQGRKQLYSMYSTCDALIQELDIPNDDLGVIDNLRETIALTRLSPSDNTIITLPMAAGAVVFPKAAGSHTAHGVWVRFTYTISATQAVEARIRTTNCSSSIGLHAVNRNVVVQLEAGCMVGEFYLPFAAPQQGSNIFAPVVASCVGAVSTVEITGFPAGAGNLSVQFVGAYSQNMTKIVSAINNAQPAGS